MPLLRLSAVPVSGQISMMWRDLLGLTGHKRLWRADEKDYILETTGNGVAILDYDGDGRNDILLVEWNPARHLRSADPQQPSTLFHNEGNGHFRNATAQSGLTQTGWGQGVCVGDYDNDGWPDLLVTYFGHNVLYRNRGNGQFEDVTRKPSFRSAVHVMARAAASLTTIATVTSTFSSRTT